MIKKFVFIVLIPLINLALIVWAFDLYNYSLSILLSSGFSHYGYMMHLSAFVPPIISLIASLIFGLKKKNIYWLLPIIFLFLIGSIYFLYSYYMLKLDWKAHGGYL